MSTIKSDQIKIPLSGSSFLNNVKNESKIFIIIWRNKIKTWKSGKENRNLIEKERMKNLKFSWEFEDGDTNEDDTEHSDGGVAFPVFRATVRATSHTPNLVPEISSIASAITVICSTTSHFCSKISESKIRNPNSINRVWFCTIVFGIGRKWKMRMRKGYNSVCHWPRAYRRAH